MELRNELVAGNDAVMFLRALVDGQALDAADVLGVIEKPWNWQREWQLWHDHDRPQDEDDDGFEAWIADVDRAA